MNFTKNYIDMMEKSPIQKDWEPKYGNYVWKDYSKTQWIAQPSYEILQEFSEDRIQEILTPDEVYPERGVPKIWWLPLEHDWWERIDIGEKYIIEIHKWNDKFYLEVEVMEGEKRYLSFEGDSILELISAFWHSKRGLKWDGERKGWVQNEKKTR